MSRLTRWWWVRHAPVINGDGMIYVYNSEQGQEPAQKVVDDLLEGDN